MAGWQKVGDLLARPGTGDRVFTDEEVAAVEDVLDAAVEWEAGRLPLGELWRVGTLFPRPWTYRGETCRGQDAGGYSRYKALNWARQHGDPRWRPLAAAIEAAHAAGLVAAREAER